MDVVLHRDAQSFLERAGPWLLSAEPENHLLLGIAGALREDLHFYGPEDPVLLTVERGGEVEAASLMTPPFKLLVPRAGEEALEALVEFLDASGPEPPGVQGPVREAAFFSRLWSRRRGLRSRPGMNLRIHACNGVIPPPAAPRGALRPAAVADLERAWEWVQGFHRDAHASRGGTTSSPGRLRARIEEGRLFFWDDDGPRTMAGIQGATPNGVRISMVYTPPEHRGRGYASACVAALAARILGEGRRHVFLYTDLANPTSNKIYRAVGFEPVCDVREFHFEAGGGG